MTTYSYDVFYQGKPILDRLANSSALTLLIKEKETGPSDSDGETDYMPIDEPEVVQPIVSLRKRVQDIPLVAIPEETLQQRIQELQRHILVEESVVRRIYEALLIGHVILTGPPGTGKTELARYIPEVLWHDVPTPQTKEDNETTTAQTTHTAYTATLVTATSEWSGRTLIGGIAPRVDGTRIAYHTEHGHLTHAILRNWDVQPNQHHAWEKAQRVQYVTAGILSQGEAQEFRGHWLIIDEFNRAQIDVALGEALTTLSTGEALMLTIQGEVIKLPLPRDFRIIGTLNSFDRSYLNQISEALKRRFSFIEVLPPSRAMRLAEQGIVLYKALNALSKIPQLGDTISRENDGDIVWQHVILTRDEWYIEDDNFGGVFTTAWNTFEIIRIYRQLGTAQAITLIQRMIIQGILRGYKTEHEWVEALDVALSDTVADQLQVLLPDELDVLLWYLKLDAPMFIEKYNSMLSLFSSKPRRLSAHLEAFGSILNEQGQPFLGDDLIEEIVDMEEPQLPSDILTHLFHLNQTHPTLPQFTKRLRTFKVERGL